MSECGLCEQQMEDGYLCTACERATVDRLVALPGLYDRLGGQLAPRGRAPGLTPATGRPSSSLPLDEVALDIRGPGGAVTLLESWRAALHDDAGWSTPTPWGDYRARLARACRSLRLSMQWIVTSWPAAGAMAEEIRDLVAGIESILDPVPAEERGARLGNCPAVDGSGVLCGAVLRHYPGQPLACGWCGTSYPAESWLQLRTWIDHDEAAAS